MVVTNEIENYIVLSEEQRKNVCEELARLVFVQKKDESVECIYFVPYKKSNDIGYSLSITIVKDDSTKPFKDVELKEYSDMHKEQETVEKCGVEIDICLASSLEYVMASDELINSFCYDLFNSTILFDRYGKYYKIIKTIKNQKGMISYYSNLAQIEPPIMDEFGEALEDCKMQGDTDAVRKFTKTETFKYIADMK